ncbi:copper homeostasis protein CutC [Streptomyces sp. N2-109]|uniref:Copper homeostasis protein cutC homolog n=1 Tax=Streptomyces gossypii TaxID=2883101 RepID=A0ABT2JXW7_9ACTN|nr:copper homeostasis protein CutC [Streptomyces gossypii]MCT2592752.1 copper homeostasis protein CutC [Streptomyces gossypii]
MSRPMLEVIALSAQDARAAEAGGADRLELITDIAADGLTPDRETFAAIRAAVGIPLRVMLRTSDGFSAGGPQALDDLRARAQLLRTEGAEEFVLGFLDESGQPDLAAIGALVEVIGTCRWTFHRAIDRAADRDGLRKRLRELPGLDTYLTAGSASGVDDGMATLLAEAERGADGEPGYQARMMVGGGLGLTHLPALCAGGVTAFHIGGAARQAGWASPVSPEAVREWRTVLDG